MCVGVAVVIILHQYGETNTNKPSHLYAIVTYFLVMHVHTSYGLRSNALYYYYWEAS